MPRASASTRSCRGDELGLDLAEELERLAPFGAGQPAGRRCSSRPPTLADPRPMGEGRHVAFTLARRRRRARARAFGAGSALPASRRAGRRRRPARAQRVERRRRAAAGARATRAVPARRRSRWSASRAFARRRRRPSCAPRPRRAAPARRAPPTAAPARDARGARHRRPARRPRRHAASRCSRSSRHAPHRARALQDRVGGLRALLVGGARGRPRPGAPATRTSWPSTRRPTRPRSGCSNVRPARAIAHLAWGEPELRFARRIHRVGLRPARPAGRPLPRTARGRGAVRGEASRPRSGARGRNRGPPRSPGVWCGSSRSSISSVLDRDGPALRLAETPGRTALERSAAFRAYQRRLEDGLRYLTSDTIQRQAA